VLRELILVLVAFPFWYLWVRIVVPVLVMPFGIDLSMRLNGFRKFRDEISQLSFAAYIVVYDILIWGCGMALSLLVMSYIRWKYLGTGSFTPTPDLVFGAIFWGIVGALIAGSCGFRKFWHGNSGNSGTLCTGRQDLF